MSFEITVSPHPVQGYAWVVVDNATGQAYQSQVPYEDADTARTGAEGFATRLTKSPQSYTFDPEAASDGP